MNKTMKRIASIVLVSAFALSFAACGKKKTLSAEDFTSKMEKEGFKVTEQEEKDGITSIGASNEDSSILVAWSKYDDSDKAKSDFEFVKEFYESLEDDLKEIGAELSTSSSELTVSSDSEFIFFSFSGDTVITISAEGSEETVSAAKDIKKALGL